MPVTLGYRIIPVFGQEVAAQASASNQRYFPGLVGVSAIASTWSIRSRG
jgi:hypothetical protein